MPEPDTVPAMPTSQQLARKGRRKKKRRARRLTGPQQSAIVVKTFVVKPRKPNSAERKMARVRLSDGREVTAFIPGEGHNLQEHSHVLVRGGRSKDLSGIHHKVVRGTLDCAPVEGRKQAKSKYGAGNKKGRRR